MVRHTFSSPRLLLCVVATTCLGACSGGLERFSGPCPSGQELREERYDATSIKARGCVGRNSENNYRREGRWEFLHPSGQKEAEGSYVDGFQGGETGNTGIPIDGREGLWAFWHENGQKSRGGTYRDGKLEDLFTMWYENGQKLSEGTYRDGLREGLATIWWENGQKQLEATYRDGREEGLATSWHENGQKSREDTYRDGLREGLATIWWENGQKQLEATYLNDTRTSVTEWDERGNQTRAD